MKLYEAKVGDMYEYIDVNTSLKYKWNGHEFELLIETPPLKFPKMPNPPEGPDGPQPPMPPMPPKPDIRWDNPDPRDKKKQTGSGGGLAQLTEYERQRGRINGTYVDEFTFLDENGNNVIAGYNI